MNDWVNENSFFGVSESERELVAKEYIAPSKYNTHKKLSTLLNVLVASSTFLIFDFNILALAISFVVFDIVMGFVDNIVCNVIPKMRLEKNKTMSLENRQKYVAKLEEKVEILAKKVDKFKKENCDNCSYYSYYSDSCKSDRGSCNVMDEYVHYKNLLKSEKRILEEETKKMEEAVLEKENPVSSDFKDKIEYFKTLKKKYSYFAKEKDMPYLKPIVISLSELMKKLEGKPFALQLVPKTLYIYLDELQNILNRLQSLSEEKQQEYLKDIEKISKALSENIEDLNRRIDKFETEDIEVSLNVLLGELVKDNMKEDKDV